MSIYNLKALVIYNLPNDFYSTEEQGKPVIIRSHQASTSSANNKSIIHQNNDFNSTEEQGKPVIIRSHQASTSSANNKSIIHQNMVDIIIIRKKTIIDACNITALEAGEMMILSKGSTLISQALPKQGLFHNLAIYFTNEILADFWIKYNTESNGNLKENTKQPFITCRQDVFISNYIDSVLFCFY